jgi:hypothetical protein
MTFQGDPTTEALAACFWLKLSAFIADDKLPFVLREVRIEETPTNTVIIDRENVRPGTCGLRAGAWPWRADMSITTSSQSPSSRTRGARSGIQGRMRVVWRGFRLYGARAPRPE